jgi:hypothetical protein
MVNFIILVYYTRGQQHFTVKSVVLPQFINNRFTSVLIFFKYLYCYYAFSTASVV